MSSKLTHLTLAGAADLRALLDIVRNEEAYNAKLAELEKVVATVNERIEMVGKVQEIESLRSETTEKAQQARKALADAQEEAERTVAGARTEAEDLRSRTKSETETLLERARATKRANDTEAGNLAAALAVAKDREATVSAREVAVSRREAELSKNEEAYAEKKRRLDLALS